MNVVEINVKYSKDVFWNLNSRIDPFNLYDNFKLGTFV